MRDGDERETDAAAGALARCFRTLDAIGVAAYVLRSSGEVVDTNAAGRSLVGRRAVEAAARAWSAGPAVVGEDPPVARGAPDRCLVVVQPQPGAAATPAARWRLTPRQTEVLGLIAQGKCNKEISSAIGCAARTVELHVTAVLAKAGCGSRTELMAKYFGALAAGRAAEGVEAAERGTGTG